MDSECKITWDKIIEIVTITIAIMALLNEIMASRSRDTRASSPMQFITTFISNILSSLGININIPANKSDIHNRSILIDQLTLNSEKIYKEKIPIYTTTKNNIRTIREPRISATIRVQDIFT